MRFDSHVIDIDPAIETARIIEMLRREVRQVMRRQGGVVGISGGVDSAVVLALLVRAFGPGHVVALMLNEKDSDPTSAVLAREVARSYGVEPICEDITAALEGFGCYARRDAAIRGVFPEYDAAKGYQAKIVLPGGVLEGTLNVFSLVIVTPEGEEKRKRIPPREYLQIVAASNFKQRTRMAMLYYHAELHNYAVIGTANRNEHEQGFFVKYGDGGVDIRPIAHCLKTQIYQLAEYLGVPEAIRTRTSTTDTYSASCTQEEFFFRLPFEMMDLLWYAQEHNVPLDQVARTLGLTEEQVNNAFQDLSRKQRTTEYLRMMPPSLAAEASAGREGES